MNGVRVALLAFGALLIAAPLAAAKDKPAPTPASLPAGGEVMLTDLDIPWEYSELGEVSAVVHQTALFTKVPMMKQLNAAMRDEALRVGADAIVHIVYEPGSPMNKKGFKATGMAVKFKQTPEQYYAGETLPGETAAPPAPSGAPQTMASAAPTRPAETAPSYTPQIGATGYSYDTPAAPSVTTPPPAASAAPPPVKPSRAAPGYAYPVREPSSSEPSVVASMTTPDAPPAPRGPTAVDKILLSDQDITYRRYVVLGEVTATVHKTALITKVPIRKNLDDSIRAEAFKLGADAVVKIDYQDGSALNKKGFTGTGQAVKFR